MGLATRVFAIVFTATFLAACTCNQKLIGSAEDLTVTPTELNFGTIHSGTSTSLPVEVRNVGKTPATIATLHFEADARGAFSTPATPFTLAPGDAFQLTLVYAAPTTPGADTATFFLTTDANTELSVALQALSADDGQTTTCVPRTCGASCGPTSDGCGATLDCLACSTPPDAGTTPPDGGTCVKTSCKDASAQCGATPDGCGGTLNCGTCTNGASCAANQCVCPGGTTEVCGDNIDNNCDGNVDCADPQCAALAACAQPACSLTDAEVRITNTSGSMPAIVNTGAGYGIFYADSALRYGFARLDTAFAIAKPAALISVVTPAHRPFPVFTGTEYGLGWSDVRNATLQYSNEVYFNRFDAQGGATLASSDLPISTGPGMAFPGQTGFSPALNEYGVLYADEGSTNSGGNQRRMFFQRVSAAGSRLGSPQKVSPAALTDGTGDYGHLAWGGSNWGAAWTEIRNGVGPNIYFSRLDSNGAPEPVDTQVSAGASYGFSPRIASNGSAFGVVYTDSRGAAPGTLGIYFQRFDATGIGAATPRLVTTLAGMSFADITWAGTHWAVVFNDKRTGIDRLYYAKLDVDGNRLGPDQLVSCQTLPVWGPTVAFDGSKLAVAFSYVQGGVYDVYAKRFTP